MASIVPPLGFNLDGKMGGLVCFWVSDMLNGCSWFQIWSNQGIEGLILIVCGFLLWVSIQKGFDLEFNFDLDSDGYSLVSFLGFSFIFFKKRTKRLFAEIFIFIF